jgi:toxin YhaV
VSVDQPLVINGWTLFAHSLFLEQFEDLLAQVEQLRQKYPEDYKKKNAKKRLAAIAKLVFDVIPQDPTRSDYRQGTTLGNEYKHWFRSKTFQQHQLFFRSHQESKIIAFTWVNDKNSKRADDSKTDAYQVFKKLGYNLTGTGQNLSMISATPSNSSSLDRYPNWKLEDAKARFSEVVRLAREQAPQRITVRGEDAVVIISAQEFAKLLPLLEQPNLHALLSQSPLSRLDFEQPSIQPTVRDVEL